MLVIVFGLPGTGKTTFGKMLAHRLQGIHLNSDVVRSLMGLRGQYDPHHKALVYETLFTETLQALNNGKTVVLDASFHQQAMRQEVIERLTNGQLPLYWIELQADDDVIHGRVSHPRPDSEADFSVFRLMQAQWEPMHEEHLILHSDQESLEQMLEKALLYVKKDSYKT